MRFIFPPLSITIGLGAGMLASRIFDWIWSKFDEEEAPDPKYREINYAKLVPALILQGAILRVVRGFVDNGLRRAFSNATGTWPGEERPEPK